MNVNMTKSVAFYVKNRRNFRGKYRINLCCFPWFMFTLCLQQRLLRHKPHKNNKNGLFHGKFMCFLLLTHPTNLALFLRKKSLSCCFLRPCSRILTLHRSKDWVFYMVSRCYWTQRVCWRVQNIDFVHKIDLTSSKDPPN